MFRTSTSTLSQFFVNSKPTSRVWIRPVSVYLMKSWSAPTSCRASTQSLTVSWGTPCMTQYLMLRSPWGVGRNWTTAGGEGSLWVPLCRCCVITCSFTIWVQFVFPFCYDGDPSGWQNSWMTDHRPTKLETLFFSKQLRCEWHDSDPFLFIYFPVPKLLNWSEADVVD